MCAAGGGGGGSGGSGGEPRQNPAMHAILIAPTSPLEVIGFRRVSSRPARTFTEDRCCCRRALRLLVIRG